MQSRTRGVPASRRQPQFIRPVVFAVCLLPFLALLWRVLSDNAGANPVETIELATGEWSLRFLLLTLALTPLSQFSGSAWPIRLRRMIGLFAFFYASLHFLAYTLLDRYLEIAAILEDLLERPFITAGFTAFVVMIPLALTSNAWTVRRLRGRWHALHRWVYIAAVAACLHFLWLAKGERLEPVFYLLVLIALLLLRIRKILS